jgi:putative heme-binding domain-containing protein
LLLAGLADKHPAARRAKALALGNVASLLKQDDPLCQLASKSLVEMLQADDGSDVYLHDGILRGLERLGPTGMQRLKELMAGDPRQRELGVLSFESLRTREASVALDQLLESDVLSDLDFKHQSRLLAAYRHILVEPPIGTTAVVNWLKQHPDVARDVQITGLETIGLLGTDDSAAIADLAIKLLQSDDPEVRWRVIRAAGDMGVKAASGPLADALADYGRSVAERREIIAALSKLRSQNLPFLNTPNAPGVETVLDKIGAVALETKAGEIRGEALALLAQVSYEQAQPIAYQLLDSSDLLAAAAAINVLGARAEDVRQIGRRFAEGTIDRSLLPRVAEVLQRHLPQDTSGDMASLLKDAFQGGLLVSLEPSEIQRVEKLVRTTGDPVNGRNVFLDKQKGQCLNCHKLEGVGGQVGPDLSKIYDTHSVAKIIESMIDPSKEIKEGYATWTVITTDGKVYSGLRISETEKEIVLRDATGNDIRIPANEIEDKAETTRSLMPDGVISQLPYQHFIDLVAFLKDKQTQQELGTSMAEK